MDKIETTIKGTVYQIPKWKYLLNWWSPIIGIVSVLLLGGIFFGNLGERLFDDAAQKYNTTQHPEEEYLHLTETQREALVSYKEFENVKEQLKSIQEELKELNQYLRGRKYNDN